MSKKIRILDSETGYNLAAPYYDEKEKYLNSFEKGQLLPLLGDVTDKKILDVGAGTGRVSVPLAKAGAVVTALDVSDEMLKVIRNKKQEIDIVIGDGESSPFNDGEFDVVVAAFFIVHLKNPSRFFDEAYRVLKDGGRLVVTNINQKEPPEVKIRGGNIIIESFYHRPEEVRELLQQLAFSIEKEIMVREGETWVNQILVCRK